MNAKYHKYWLTGLLGGLFMLVSCSHEADGGETAVPEDGYSIDLMVSSRGDGAQTDDEKHIHSVYVYAYDDNYLSSPDYHFDRQVNSANQGVYPFRMKIHDVGQKRFYVIVNPPKYIVSELKPKVREDFLKSLSLYMYNPAFRIDDIPQSIDGVSKNTRPTGFPMGNMFEAYVGQLHENHRDVYLFAQKDALDPSPIRDIPLFRSLGKITVLARLNSNYSGRTVAVDQIELFNYTGDGYLLPYWDNAEPYWSLRNNLMVWNPDLRLDLETMAGHETKTLTTPYKLLRAPVEIQSKQMVSTPITKFYLCQNSFGRKANALDRQEGLPDVMGNRESRMMVYLNDGRVSEVILPFLRRNDNLRVTLAISEFGLNVEFEKWNTSDVNPDWDEVIQ